MTAFLASTVTYAVAPKVGKKEQHFIQKKAET
jgi:hypothetical protein